MFWKKEKKSEEIEEPMVNPKYDPRKQKKSPRMIFMVIRVILFFTVFIVVVYSVSTYYGFSMEKLSVKVKGIFGGNDKETPSEDSGPEFYQSIFQLAFIFAILLIIIFILYTITKSRPKH